MNKRKIFTLALTVAMVAILAVGGSLAYLFDTDAKTNVFTTGNVEIQLNENFGDNNPDTPEKLLPATGSAQDDTLENGIVKEVTVENIGSEDAFVRVHIAIPQILDNGSPDFDAGKNVLHFNYNEDSVGEGKWDWSKTVDAPFEGDYNFYTSEIDGIWYNVYVVTYGTALASGEETAETAMSQVYLDKKVTNADINDIKATLGNNWQIKVIAEGAQAEGFDDAYAALNASFGIPGEYTVDWSGAVNQ